MRRGKSKKTYQNNYRLRNRLLDSGFQQIRDDRAALLDEHTTTIFLIHEPMTRNGPDSVIMIVQPITISDSDIRIPAIRIGPSNPIGAVVLIHGYGGCKEEQLGLAWHVAQSGVVVDCIDLRGHGEHPLPFDEYVLQDVETAIQHSREFGKVVAIGHSLGGRLSLASSADFTIGISPPLEGTHGVRTEELIRKLRGHRVNTDSPRRVFELLAKLPKWENRDESRWMIIYGSRDVPEIVASCERLSSARTNVLRIEGAMHSDTYLLSSTFEAIRKQLRQWLHESH